MYKRQGRGKDREEEEQEEEDEPVQDDDGGPPPAEYEWDNEDDLENEGETEAAPAPAFDRNTLAMAVALAKAMAKTAAAPVKKKKSVTIEDDADEDALLAAAYQEEEIGKHVAKVQRQDAIQAAKQERRTAGGKSKGAGRGGKGDKERRSKGEDSWSKNDPWTEQQRKAAENDAWKEWSDRRGGAGYRGLLYTYTRPRH